MITTSWYDSNTTAWALCLRTVLCSREQLGWTFRGSAYCQLIRNVNKEKRLLWALQHQNDRFENVIFSDEASIQLETGKKERNRKTNPVPNIHPRCMYGLESVQEVLLTSASLLVQWMPSFMWKFSTPNMFPAVLRLFLRRTMSTGGEPLPSPQT